MGQVVGLDRFLQRGSDAKHVRQSVYLWVKRQQNVDQENFKKVEKRGENQCFHLFFVPRRGKYFSSQRTCQNQTEAQRGDCGLKRRSKGAVREIPTFTGGDYGGADFAPTWSNRPLSNRGPHPPSLSRRKPAKRLRCEKRRNSYHSAVFAARRKRNGDRNF